MWSKINQVICKFARSQKAWNAKFISYNGKSKLDLIQRKIVFKWSKAQSNVNKLL